MIFLLLYMVFHSVTEAAVLIFPTFYAMTGGLWAWLQLQRRNLGGLHRTVWNLTRPASLEMPCDLGKITEVIVDSGMNKLAGPRKKMLALPPTMEHIPR